MLLAMEWARTNKNRGFLASWPQFGAPAGLFLANVAVLVFSWLSGDQFLVWGWRIPFLLSIVMVGVGLWIRLGILETPVFQKVLDEERIERAPVLEVLRRQPKQIILTALLRMPEQAPGYIVGAFIFTYGTTVLGISRDFLLIGRHRQTVLGFLWVAVAGHLSDTRRPQEHVHDRLRVHGRSSASSISRMLDTRVPMLIFIAIALSLIPVMTHVRPGGGADRGELHAAAALQRRLARLSACLDHRRRSVAVHRDVAVRDLSLDVADRDLCLCLRGHQHLRDVDAARLHQQGHLARGALRQCLSVPSAWPR